MSENKKITLQQDTPPPKGLGVMLSSLFIVCCVCSSKVVGSNHADLKLSYPKSIHIPGICFEIDVSIYLESIQ